MLDHRVYRAAFLPALVALFVLAFSLADPPRARTTRLAPLAFDAGRAFSSLGRLARAFPDRRPGSAGDAGLADRVAAYFESTGFAKGTQVRRERFAAKTIEGDADLENVVATRQGLSSHTIVVLAHRDAVGAPAAAELSGTAALLELSRLLADRDLAKTVVLASVSGGSGGFAGAREIAERAPGAVDAVFVLGNLAGTRERRPFIVPWSDGGAPASYGLERTVQVALRRELGVDPGRVRATVQAIRRTLALTLSEQGVVNAAGDVPAVLISGSGERRPAADEPIGLARFTGFGRGTLRALTAALEAPGRDPFPRGDGIVALKRLVPTWAIRVLVLALLLPALLTAFDGFFRVRRRGLPMGAWSLWVASYALPFVLAWLWARGLGATGAVIALGAPVSGDVPRLGAAGWASMASVAVIGAGVALGLRPLLLRGLKARTRAPDLASGAAAAATGLALSGLVLAVWLVNPYAAAVLLPAAHAWLLISAPDRRLPRGVVLAGLAAGLCGPLAIAAYYAQAWGVGPAEALWSGFGIVAGGVLSVTAALAGSVFAATLCATVAVLRARRSVAETATAEPIRTRGPSSYAGPGSLGGTESALHR